MRSPRLWGLFAIAGLLCLGACSDDADAITQVFVWVEAEPSVTARSERVRVRVDRADGDAALAAVSAPKYPVKLSLVPRGGDARREYAVVAEALDEDGEVFARARLVSDFVPNEIRHVRLILEDSCIGMVTCGDRTTCHQGTCVDALVDSSRFGDGADDAPDSTQLWKTGDAGDAPDAAADADVDAFVHDGGASEDAGDAGALLPVEACKDAIKGRSFCVDHVVRVCSSSVAYQDTVCDTHAECVPTPLGARCECDDGYTGTGEQCVDVNECKEDNGGCDSLTDCNNTMGGRTCTSCPSAYAGSGETGCAPVLTTLGVRSDDDARLGSLELWGDPADTYAVPLPVKFVELAYTRDSASSPTVTFGIDMVAPSTWTAISPLATGITHVPAAVSEAGHPTTNYSLKLVRGAQAAYLKATYPEAGDAYGQAVAISGPQSFAEWPVGLTVAAGAPYEDGSATGIGGDAADNGATESGAVYVSVATGADGAAIAFEHQAYVKASNTGAGDHFGMRVALDGDTLVVGAPDEDSDGTGDNDDLVDSGAVYVFVRSGSVWTQQAILKAENAGAGDGFGDAVTIEGDTLVVGAPDEDSGETGTAGVGDDDSAADSGAVYVFVRNGSAWTQQAYLKASNTDADDRFGRGVGISGNSLVVGAVDEASAADGVGGDQSNNDAPGAGAAYVFIRNAGTWTQQAYLKPTHSGAGDSFGYRVVIDGDTVAVSAPFEASGTQADGSDDSEPEAGAVYVFARSSGVWTQQAYLKAIAPVQYDWFGIGVALLGDRVLIGAAHENGAGTGFRSDDNSDALPVSGAVYVFERDVTQWTYIAYAKAANAGSGDQFGYAVDLFDDVMLVGARTERSSNDDPGDDGAPAAGAVYVLR